MIGKQILNYRIESLIGQGGMGSVFLASNINIDQKVAIKVLNPGLTNNAEIRKRFEREATTLASLDHQNIVKFLNYFENEEGIFLIMEFVKGMTLDDYINDVTGPIPAEKTLDLFSQILDAFSYAHDQGIIHRDIKPSNIIITKDLKIKILDFGIARIIKESVPSVTKTGTKIGTAMYMSPEQVRGKEVDKRSDIYSLGIVLYQMITGRAPYDDTTLSEFDINVKVVEEKLPRAKEFYPFVSDKVQAIIDKAVEKSPDNRYHNCEDFKYHLTKAIKPENAVKPKINPIYKWSAIASGLIILLAGFWFWDYNRTKVKYYKDFVEQWGIPQGIYKLSNNEFKHREGSYRFEFKRGKLQRFSRVNSAGKIREHHDSEHTEFPNDMKLYYTEDGKLDYTEYLDRNGKILFKKDYNPNLNVVIFKHADQFETEFALSGRTLQAFNNPFSNESDERGQISRYLITYDQSGFIKKIQYAKYQNVLVGDKDGIFGREYIRDKKGRVIEEHYLGYDGKPKATKKGLGIKKHTYADNDDWVETRYLDINNNLVTDETGVPIVKLSCDKYGNRIKEEYCDEKGNLVFRKDSKSAGFVYKYDEKGNNIERMNIDLDGKICTGSEGAAGYKFEYDEFGNTIKTVFLNTDYKPCFSTDGIAIIQSTYDNKGNIIEQWYYDEKEKLCITQNNIAGYKEKLDSLGNVTEYIYFGLNKKPSINSDGVACYRITYNEMNKIVKAVSLDTSLQPTFDKNNTAIIFRRYDKRGNQTGVSYYDITGKHLHNNINNIAGWNSTFDDQGNEVSRSYFNTDSVFCSIDDGYAKWTSKYDDKGNQIESRYYNTAGNICLSKDGYAGWNCKYDERSNQEELMYVDANEKPAPHKLISKSKYDKNDNLIEYSLFKSSGEPALNTYGFASYKSAFDARNKEIEKKYYGINGKLSKTNDNYAIIRYKYDNKGNCTEITYYDEFEKPCLNKDKISKQVSEYNSQGQIIRQAYFNEKEEPTSYNGGSPEVKVKYDKWGNRIEFACYDGNGHLIKNENGWAIKKMEYDIKGNILMTAFWGADQKPCTIDGYAKVLFVYNKDGKKTEEKYFNQDGKPRTDNFAFVRYSYDKSGNLLETTYYNSDNKPCETSNKFYKIVNCYDNTGKLKMQKFYRLDGSLLGSLDGNGNVISNAPQENNTFQLQDLVKQINEKCPITVVEGLIFVKAKYLSTSSIIYIWKLTDYSKYKLDEDESSRLASKVNSVASQSKYVQFLVSKNIRIELTINDKADRFLYQFNY